MMAVYFSRVCCWSSFWVNGVLGVCSKANSKEKALTAVDIQHNEYRLNARKRASALALAEWFGRRKRERKHVPAYSFNQSYCLDERR
mgnify:CR=1 FL=1